MSSGNEHVSWGRMPWCNAHVLPVEGFEVLDTERACEQATLHVSDNSPGSHLCEGWRLVFPQISPYQLCYLFLIL